MELVFRSVRVRCAVDAGHHGSGLWSGQADAPHLRLKALKQCPVRPFDPGILNIEVWHFMSE